MAIVARTYPVLQISLLVNYVSQTKYILFQFTASSSQFVYFSTIRLIFLPIPDFQNPVNNSDFTRY